MLKPKQRVERKVNQILKLLKDLELMNITLTIYDAQKIYTLIDSRSRHACNELKKQPDNFKLEI